MTVSSQSLPAQGGILFVDKDEGWTSHDVVAKARRALGTRKVGHAGTLDPMATGLLVLGAGPSTRLLTHLVGLDKTYTATVRLGITTVTDDREGEETAVADAALVERLSDEAVEREVRRLTGEILQVPSSVSAVKVGGRRAYDRVRAGEDVELAGRAVTIRRFAVSPLRRTTDESGRPVVDLDAVIECSSGTYVRALARDLGAALGVGGHLTALRRDAVGAWNTASAIPTAALADRGSEGLVAPAEIARELFPTLELTANEATALGQGKRLEIEPDRSGDAERVAALGPDGRLVGLVSVAQGRTRVVTNFPTPERNS